MKDWRRKQKKLLYDLMVETGCLQIELAGAVSVSRSTVSRWRQGETTAPWYAVDYLQKLKEARRPEAIGSTKLTAKNLEQLERLLYHLNMGLTLPPLGRMNTRDLKESLQRAIDSSKEEKS